ncbi:MAG: hypothetical protein LBI31_03270, partial [Zoogloeaceae bacterium]|nr:hypothetical protein [Zoogloeaceae bacterium]
FLKPGKLWVIPFVASLTYFAYYFQRYSRRHDRLRIDDQGIHLEERGDKPWSWHIAWKEIQLPIHIHMQSNVLYIQSKRPDNNPRQDERERKGILDRLFGSANTPENSVFILGHVSAWRQTDRKTAGTKTDKRPAVVHAIERYLGQNAVEKIRRFDLISKLRNQAEKTKNSRKDP